MIWQRAFAEIAGSVLLRGSVVVVAKSFMMVVLATLLGPVIGIGLFVLMQGM